MRQALSRSTGISIILRQRINCHKVTSFNVLLLSRNLKSWRNNNHDNRLQPTNWRTFSSGDNNHSSNTGSNHLPVKKENGDEYLPSVIPIDFSVASKVQGEESQNLFINIEPGQKLRAESGAMLFMTQGIEMNTTMGDGGIGSGLKRMMTGQNLFLSDFTYNGDKGTSGTVGLGTDFPSKIIQLDLQDYGGKIVCQKGAFLAGGSTVQIEMEFTKRMTAGFFGGEGFVLQSLIGEDTVFIKAGGTLVKKELQPGETLRVSSGSLVAFTQDVEFDVQTMPGFKNVMFGGEGLFITTLTGPGTVWLQGMPPDRMISEIARRVPSGGGIGLGIPIGMGGGGDGGGGIVTDENAEDVDESTVESGEEAVAATDAAVDADRQATVASSGFMGDENDANNIDSESPESLFGDAAFKDDSSPSSSSTSSDDVSNSSDEFNDTNSFSSFGSSDPDTNNYGEQQPFDDNDSQIFDDQTSFSTDFDGEDDFSSTDGFDSENNFSSDLGESTGDGEGGIGSIISTLWDFFRDDE